MKTAIHFLLLVGIGHIAHAQALPELEPFVAETGSYIAEPEFTATQIQTFDEKDIFQSGRQNLAEIIRLSPAITGPGNLQGRQSGLSSAAEQFVALRGLPANATLVLFNGQRLAYSAGAQTDNDAVNIATLPFLAVNQIDILNQGAAATYGSDAIAGVINILSLRDYEGAKLYGYYGYADNQNSYTIGGIAGGKVDETSITVMASYEHEDNVLSKDRNLTETANFTRFGFADFRSTSANPPLILPDSGGFLQLNPGGDPNVMADYSGFDRPYDYYPEMSALSETDTASFYANVNHPLQKVNGVTTVEAYMTGYFTWMETQQNQAPAPVAADRETVDLGAGPTLLFIPATNPHNPFGENVLWEKRFSELGDRVLTTTEQNFTWQGGLQGERDALNWNWNVGISQDYSKLTATHLVNANALQSQILSTDPGSINLFGPSSLNVGNPNLASLDYTTIDKGTYRILSTNGSISDELIQTDAGPIIGAAGLELRNEYLDFSPDSLKAQGLALGAPAQAGTNGDRTVFGMFGEARVPVLNNTSTVEFLNLNLAGRGEYYSDFGWVGTPAFRIAARPKVVPVTFSGNVETGYRAPGLQQLYQGNRVNYQPISNPLDTGQGVVGVRESGYSQLDPEKSLSWGVGFEADPTDSFVFGAGFWQILQNDVIGLPSPQFLVDQAIAGNELPAGSQVTFGPGGTVTSISSRYANLGKRRVEGIDMNGAWRALESDAGSITLGGRATYIASFKEQSTPAGAYSQNAGQFDALNGVSIPRWKTRLSATGEHKGWALTLAWNFISSTRETNLSPARQPIGTRYVGSWSSFDLQLAYEYEGWTAAIGVNNLNNEQPPYSVQQANIFNIYDRSQYSILGRQFYIEVAKEF